MDDTRAHPTAPNGGADSQRPTRIDGGVDARPPRAHHVSMARGWGLLVVAIASALGCGGESLAGRSPAGTGGGGMSATGGTFGTGAGGDLGIDRTPFCGEMQAFPVSAPVPPDILILMDRSSSLLDDSTGMSCTGGCGARSKWALLTAAIEKLVTSVGSVNWGLMFFGTDDACGTNLSPAVPFPASAASSMMIVGALDAATTGGDAPTTAALSAAAEYLGSLSDGSPRYVLLVTGGKSGCSSDPATANLSFPTFVLAAVAPSDTTAIAALNQLAVNGGEAQQGGANAFYTTTDDLSSVLDPTATSLATACTIPLLGPLPAGMMLAIGGQLRDDVSIVTPIPQDPTNGWVYGPGYTTIILNGTSCQSSKDGSYGQIFVTYQCNEPALLGHGRAQGR
jgi:hypothetical protein